MVSDEEVARLYYREARRQGDMSSIPEQYRAKYLASQKNNTFTQPIPIRNSGNVSIKSIFPQMNQGGNTMKGAPMRMQRQWKNMSPADKMIKRMTYQDRDKDGVPDKWDCQPRNRFRQDTGQTTDSQDTIATEPVATIQHDQPVGPEKPSFKERVIQKYRDYKEEKRIENQKLEAIRAQTREKEKQSRFEEKARRAAMTKEEKLHYYSDKIFGPQGGIVTNIQKDVNRSTTAFGYGPNYSTSEQKIQSLLGAQGFQRTGGLFGIGDTTQYGQKRVTPSDKITMLTGVGSQGGIYAALGMKNPNTTTYKGRDPEARREYMKNYMRYRRAVKGRK